MVDGRDRRMDARYQMQDVRFHKTGNFKLETSNFIP